MMKEVLLLDENGNIGEKCEKLKAHTDGLYHLAYSVIIKDKKGRILLQKRADEKYHSGGKWSNACCSHPDSGELSDIITHAAARLSEEMGFTCGLRRLTEFSYKAQVGELVENERDIVLYGTYIGDVTPDKSEVSDYKWIEPKKLYKQISKKPDDFSPWFVKMTQIPEIKEYLNTKDTVPYDPFMTKYPYTDKTDGHYLKVKYQKPIVFDENYPYVDRSFKYKFRHALLRIATVLLAFPVARIRSGLKVKGRENLKKHKDVIKNGIVSAVNHVFIWDFICIEYAVRPYMPWIPVWDKNMRGENRVLIRYSNGIPLPVGDLRATSAFSKTIDGLLRDEKEWVHFSAEGSMWEYYMPVRPFKKGAFTFAVRSGKPVLPMAFSFRKSKGLRRLFTKNPVLTLTIGEPVFPDMSLGKVAAADKLTSDVHAEVCRLAGIDPNENIYPPVFNNTDRIDYYTTKYGE
ncbi:MAG: isopentenyl-diphosphate Delta-isomerase [Clostridia bacterium]|nr:isopentenyl-diphosphate Delta-isomerase [Clostridia bacterium]